MMHQKALLFNDKETAEEILKESSPKKQKELSRQVKNFNQKIWDVEKFNLIINLNYEKFTTYKNLHEVLLGTFPYILVEAAPWDRIWGCGSGTEDEETYDVKKWQGQNLLGKALMCVRERLYHE